MSEPIASSTPNEGVIDACVFHEWSSTQTLAPYLPAGWRELLVEPGVGIQVSLSHRNPFVAESPIRDYEALVERVLDNGERERIVLSFDAGLRSTTNQNHFVAQAIAEAANRWTEEEWLGRDDRVYGLVIVPCALPQEAAAEIRRSGANPRMVGVALGSAVLGAPLGHPVYQPIYEAAVEAGLPIVLQSGIDATHNAISPTVSGGLPATTAEYRALAWQTQAAHVSSLIMQGVLDRFPSLQVLLFGAGALWLPGHLWRVDHRFAVSRGDGRWIERRPTEYADRFVCATHMLEPPPRAEQLERALSVLPEIDHRLVYASGFPDAEAESPQAAVAGLPEAWRPRVLRGNALDFFRWPDTHREVARDIIGLEAEAHV